MKTKLIELAERRAALVAKAAQQRTELSQAAAPWHGPLAVVDQGVKVAHYLKRHPVLLAGAAAALAIFRPRRSVRWLRHGWLVWTLALRARKILIGI